MSYITHLVSGVKQMVGERKKVFVALSGGVDSSTAVALLLEAEFDCAGVFMITHDNAGPAQADAEKVAEKLGIKLHILDLRKDFEQILDYFCDEYGKGRTRKMAAKFGLEADYVAKNLKRKVQNQNSKGRFNHGFRRLARIFKSSLFVVRSLGFIVPETAICKML